MRFETIAPAQIPALRQHVHRFATFMGYDEAVDAFLAAASIVRWDLSDRIMDRQGGATGLVFVAEGQVSLGFPGGGDPETTFGQGTVVAVMDLGEGEATPTVDAREPGWGFHITASAFDDFSRLHPGVQRRLGRLLRMQYRRATNLNL